MRKKKFSIKYIGSYPAEKVRAYLEKFLNEVEKKLPQSATLKMVYYNFNERPLICNLQISFADESNEGVFFTAEADYVHDIVKKISKHVYSYFRELERARKIA